MHRRHDVRAIWKGHLRLSLVSIPVRVFSATNPGATIRFHELHRQCLTRLQHRKWCPKDEVEVPKEDIVRGYEFEPGRYVVVTDEEIEQAQPEETHVIDLVQFVDASDLNPLLIDVPYYLAPDGKPAAASFAVMREALGDKAGIGTLALRGHESLVAIVARGGTIVLLMMRHTDELRSTKGIEELKDLPSKVNANEVKLARQVMSGFERKVDLDRFRDAYEDNLRTIIDAKVKGKEVVATAPAEARPKVVNLMDALRQSLDRVARGTHAPVPRTVGRAPRTVEQASRGRKRPARAAAHTHARGHGRTHRKTA